MKKVERPPATPDRDDIVQRRAQLPRRPPLGQESTVPGRARKRAPHARRKER